MNDELKYTRPYEMIETMRSKRPFDITHTAQDPLPS